ncbi:hypothetical protein QTG54_011372 [Skeletonema marinoi]|uniref:Ribonuclease II winged helix domain-containing protein n=1 Tax=Skeletonema marinoi TaxID=267567 RepID=A0AAD8Y2N9_9STRA|nr:hypothetical protein QTG54_011372 [Skeletonema marinoi]|eukprot:scaffold1662_cov121-Skeletonema_marinoi.AAC.11
MKLLNRLYLTALTLSSLEATSAFVARPHLPSTSVSLHGKKDSSDEVVQQQAFSAGSFIEFEEKKRIHVGKIDAVEHKSSGGARYTVIDSEGKKFNIADKSVRYSMACPNSPGQANKLYEEFISAQDTPMKSLQESLDVSPELLEMAWEEATEELDGEAHADLTPSSFVELVHAHAASAMEKYLTWKLLQSDMAHVFFKEIKSHGRIVAFRAKPRKAVDNAKDMFCRDQDNEDNELCFV